MNSYVHIWQSPFLKYFTTQQHHRWFRSRAASSVLINLLFLLVVATERHCQLLNWLFPSLTKYSYYHSQICLAIIILLCWNILDFGARYVHCCYQLSRKFIVNSEEEKADLSRSFHGAAASGLVAVRRLSSSSPQKRTQGLNSSASMTSPSLMLPASTSSPRAPSPLDSVYLPSASPASARHQQRQQQQQQQASLSLNSPSAAKYIGSDCISASSANSGRRVTSFGGASSDGTSGDLSAYFSPPRNLSALSVSLLLGGSGGSHSHHSLQHLQQHQPPHHMDDFSYLSRLRYQLGTPSPARPFNRSSRSSAMFSPARDSVPNSASDQQPDSSARQKQQQQQQQSALTDASGSHRLNPEQTIRYLGIDRELACSPRGLDRWLQGIRAWLHGTLIEPLSRDVETANARLKEAGASVEMLIGQASLAQLQAATASAATGSAPWSRTLAPLLPYLQACEDQAYLVRRLAELASLPCLGAYRWDAGSPGHWIAERHPSDARLLMSLLAAYLDRCLPPLPGNQRPFSTVFLAAEQPPTSLPDHQQQQQHQLQLQLHRQQSSASLMSSKLSPVVAASAAAVAAASAGVELRIAPSSRQPPHYQLLLLTGQQQQQPQLTTLDVTAGSRNLFYCILFFFYYYNSRRNGRLRQVSLGESGLNLDWIFRPSSTSTSAAAAAAASASAAAAGNNSMDIEDLLLRPPTK